MNKNYAYKIVWPNFVRKWVYTPYKNSVINNWLYMVAQKTGTLFGPQKNWYTFWAQKNWYTFLYALTLYALTSSNTDRF